MTTQADHDTAVIRAAAELEARIEQAVRAEYPALTGWRMRRNPIIRTGPGEDDWRWDESRRGKARRARQFLADAVRAAAIRISECYGLGLGSEWAARHFAAEGDERAALRGHTG